MNSFAAAVSQTQKPFSVTDVSVPADQTQKPETMATGVTQRPESLVTGLGAAPISPLQKPEAMADGLKEVSPENTAVNYRSIDGRSSRERTLERSVWLGFRVLLLNIQRKLHLLNK